MRNVRMDDSDGTYIVNNSNKKGIESVNYICGAVALTD